MAKKINISKTRLSRSNRQASHTVSVERIIVGGSLLMTLLILAAVLLNAYLNRPIVIDGVEQIPIALSYHTEAPVTYNETPPASGLHYPVWQNCGIYNQPIRDELAVHSLEHGAVWITYDPNSPDVDVETLQNLAQRSTHRLLSPYPNLPSPIVITAWGYQLQLEQADDPRLVQFIRQYEQGSTTPELGAVCSGGESRTLMELMG